MPGLKQMQTPTLEPRAKIISGSSELTRIQVACPSLSTSDHGDMDGGDSEGLLLQYEGELEGHTNEACRRPLSTVAESCHS